VLRLDFLGLNLKVVTGALQHNTHSAIDLDPTIVAMGHRFTLNISQASLEKNDSCGRYLTVKTAKIGMIRGDTFG
jgi:hypothetical protein